LKILDAKLLAMRVSGEAKFSRDVRHKNLFSLVN
jgi:hypothetical protein